jgi:hypothetical protein
VYWFLFVKQPAQQRYPNITSPSEQDTKAIAEKFRTVAAGPDFTFGDLWDTRLKDVFLPLEEGIVPGPWNLGRAILIGDSIHKVSMYLPGGIYYPTVLHWPVANSTT